MTTYLKGSAWYAVVGAGLGALVGGTVGIFNVYKTNNPSESVSVEQDTKDSLASYKFVSMDPFVVEALSRFQTYKNVIGSEYDKIVSSLDRLIEMQVKINNGQSETHFPYRATQYVSAIQSALAKAKHKVRNVSVPHWDVDEASIKQIAEDYLFNINQDVNAYLLQKRNT